MFKKTGIVLALSFLSTSVMAVEYMDAAWAKQACDAWNKNTVLTTELGKNADNYSWVKNNAGRGYKLVQMYRSSCGVKSKIQLNIVEKAGKAICVYGGKPDGKKMNYAVDYLMHATNNNWNCMGRGSWGCGAMGAMMTGKLKFNGPKMEAMKVMEPFEGFLKLAGKIPGNQAACPK